MRPARHGAHVLTSPYQGMGEFEELERAVGRLQIVHLFQQWQGPIADVRPDWIETAAAGGRDVLLTWEPWDPTAGPEQPRFSLRAIAAGEHTAYVRAFARGLRSVGRPVYVRPMHEMNSSWYPWAAGANGNTAEQYAAAWRRLRDDVAAEGADNVRWVWCPIADAAPGAPAFARLYPGDDAVDVLALDGYNWGADKPEYGGWRGFRDIFQAALEELTALGPQPVWIAETASAADGGGKPAWVRRAARAAARHPRIEAVVWFNLNKERDWRLTSPPQAAAALKKTRARLDRLGRLLPPYGA